MRIFEKLAEYSYEQLVFCHDAATGLRAVIAIPQQVGVLQAQGFMPGPGTLGVHTRLCIPQNAKD